MGVNVRIDLFVNAGPSTVVCGDVPGCRDVDSSHDTRTTCVHV